MALSPFLSDQRQRRWWLLGAALIVVALTVGTVVGMKSPRRENSTAAESATYTQPTGPTLDGAPLKPVPGLTPALEKKIWASCGGANGKKQANGSRIYHLVTTGTATDVLIFSKTWSIGCMVNPNGTGGSTYIPGRTETAWLSGPATIDLTGGENKHAWMPAGYDVVGGRVPSAVARVSLTINGSTQSLKPLNGTYLARIPRTKTVTEHGDSGPAVVVKTFDAMGKQLAVVRSGSDERPCVQTPDGRRLDPWNKQYQKSGKCITGVRWA